ncbi:MAG TPA: type II toxin-antitoxin system VapB family antitoxin [Rhizomicrobium sp.]
MKDQVYIRNAEAAHLARTLAKQTGTTINAVVPDALRQYRPRGGAPVRGRRLSHWRRLLRKDREGRLAPEAPIESLYDETAGLPL